MRGLFTMGTKQMKQMVKQIGGGATPPLTCNEADEADEADDSYLMHMRLRAHTHARREP